MLSNSAWRLLGFGVAIAVLHVAVVQFCMAIGLCLAHDTLLRGTRRRGETEDESMEAMRSAGIVRADIPR